MSWISSCSPLIVVVSRRNSGRAPLPMLQFTHPGNGQTEATDEIKGANRCGSSGSRRAAEAHELHAEAESPRSARRQTNGWRADGAAGIQCSVELTRRAIGR